MWNVTACELNYKWQNNVVKEHIHTEYVHSFCVDVRNEWFLIKNMEPSKAQGHDTISTSMAKI